MPEVSVIIPTWNRAGLLERAVRSALAQSLPPLEILVCDDGSTDGSEERVRSIGDPRVRWLPGERGGRPAIPRNRGIRESRGEWLAFLDNDDEWFPDKLERQLVLVKRLGCLAACGNAVRFVSGIGETGDYLAWDRERITFNDMLRLNRVICSSALVHRTLVEKGEGFPEAPEFRALEDYVLWLKIAVHTDFAFVREPVLVYRDDAAHSIRGEAPDTWRQFRIALQEFSNWGRSNAIDARYLVKARRRLSEVRLLGAVKDFVCKVKSSGRKERQ